MNDDEPQPIECRAAIEISPTATNEILFLPIGLHAITPVHGGIGRPIKVKIGIEAANAIEKQRQVLVASGKRPYFDFNHENGPASFWPESFIWRNGEGVIASGEWSRRGKTAVEGKDFRAFSPVFHVDNKRAEAALVICKENADPNMGGLVNNPAFKDLPLWAKNAESLGNAGASGDNAENGKQMENEELAALRAKQEELQKEVEALKASNSNDQKLSQTQAELRTIQLEVEAAELRAESESLKSQIRARNKEIADKEITDAIKSGRILPKDNKTIEYWRTEITARPEVAERLKAIPSKDAILGSRITSLDSRVSVQNEAPEAIFGAMARINRQQRVARKHADKVEASKEYAAVFANEFRVGAANRERLLSFPMDKLEDAIMAADVTDGDLGTLAGTLVVQRTLELLKFAFPSLSMFTTDFTAEQATFNQTIMTRTVDIPDVQDYSTSTGWADSTASTQDVPITIDKHKGVPITFNEQILASTVRRLFDEQAPAQAYALAKQMVDDLYVNITDANFTNGAQTVAIGSWTRSSVIDAGIALDLAGVPSGIGNRTMLLYPTYFGALEKDAALISLAAFQKPELITNPTGAGVSLVIPVESFNVVKAPNMPTNNGNIVGFAGSKSALCIASRMPNDYTKFAPGVSFGNVQTVTDPDLGLSVMLVQYVNHTLATGTQRISLMYGTAAGQTNAGLIIKAHSGSGSSRTS